MWTSVTCGTGTVKAETKVASDSGTVAIIDLGKSSNATVRMNWVRQTLPDFAMPFYFAGGLLALLAVLAASLFAMPPHKRRKRVVSGSAAEKQTEEVAVSQAVAGSVASLKAAVSFKPKSSAAVMPRIVGNPVRARRQSRKSPSRRSSIPAAATLSPTSRTRRPWTSPTIRRRR